MEISYSPREQLLIASNWGVRHRTRAAGKLRGHGIHWFQTGDPELPCLFTLPHQCGRLEGRRPLAESAVGLRWRATYRTLASDTHPSGLGTMEAIVLVRGPGRGL